MSREVVFDIETIGDIRNFDTMKVTVVSIYEYETDSYRSFVESELNQLWPILEKAERIIGYNSEHFDVPILNRYYAGDLTRLPHLDLLKVIKETSGTRFKLNDIAKATLQIEKSADGMQAMKWFEEGKIDEIKKYCEQDVKVTKEVYDYGRKNKMIYYSKLTGELQPLAVNFDPPIVKVGGAQGGGNNINLTLPF
ncbi:MAG TPA: ribonuclease H-like domain-containing protein [Candidatus Magasanikbacteria bacterium]|nr:ribonuclease H-like domain-containing protein [Candidatus Magasanikbacteria bacterium]